MQVWRQAKFSEAPTVTRSMRIAKQDLELDELWIVHPGPHRYPVDQGISAIPLTELPEIAGARST